MPETRVGLALSGGGYRASLFHLGALWRLNELGWLRKLDCITSVSGGSIVAGYLGSRWSDLEFEPDKADGVATNFCEVFLQPMRDTFGTTIDVPTIVGGLLNPVGSTRNRVNGKTADNAIDLVGELAERMGGSVTRKVATTCTFPFAALLGTTLDASAILWDTFNIFPTPTDLLIKTYDRLLFDGKTLQDLPIPERGKNPEFLLYATNMQSGASVRMSREKLADYKVGEIPNPDVALARAVAASSGFPPFYCPVEIEVDREKWKRVGGDLTVLQTRMDLGDGGIYDNLGLTTLRKRKYETILVSDAGNSLEVIDALTFEWVGQVIRWLRVSMDQNNNLRVNDLRKRFYKNKLKGTYWGIAESIADLGWGIKGDNHENKKSLEEVCKAPALLKDSDETRALGQMRTRLNRFTDEEQENLINWGYALSDARMRRWVIAGLDRPGKLPYPGRLE